MPDETIALNQFKVPTKQWRKWHEKARSVFNEVYFTLTTNQKTMCHPKAAVIPEGHFKTIAWNAAWVAADAANR